MGCLAFAIGLGGATTPMADERQRYFSWVTSNQYPPLPAEELSAEEAAERESNGSSYYIATYDLEGRLIQLEKRYRSKRYACAVYSYREGKVVPAGEQRDCDP